MILDKDTAACIACLQTTVRGHLLMNANPHMSKWKSSMAWFILWMDVVMNVTCIP
jgi:hypothetical protein